MRIIVPIKQVPETSAVKMDEKTGTMIREGVEAIINPLDLYAIETALRIREKVGGEVTAISMGPPKTITALKEAIAMGVDLAVLLSDKAFAGADTWATSLTLSEAIKTFGKFDLIICGERATDGDTGQVGPGIAAWLDLPLATYVGKIEYFDSQKILVHRLTEHGYEKLEIDLPALLTVVKEIADPRLPTLSGKKKAKTTPIPVLGKEQLKLDPKIVGLEGSPTRVVKIFKPKVSRTCRKFVIANGKGMDEAWKALSSLLRERGLV
jgi:electron transfer flavoprotein beta subunit